MADAMLLIKIYATAIVVFMTVDAIKGLNSFASLSWFFQWGCAVILVAICAMVTYGELAGVSFKMDVDE